MNATKFRNIYVVAFAELIPEAIYNSQWTNIDKNSKLTFQIIMSRCQKKLICGAYGLVNVNHEQITQVLANDIIAAVDTNKNGNSKTLSMELKYIVMRHEELYKLIDIMNNQLYSSVIFVSFIIGMGYLTFMNILYTISVWQDDVDSAITMLSIVFTVMVTITKGIIIWFYQEELFNILNNLHEKWNKSWTRIEIRDQILETVIRVTKFRNIYVIALIGLFITYTYPPIGNSLIYFYRNANQSLDYNKLMWPAEVYPIKIDTFFKYLCISTIEICQAFFYIIYCHVGDIFYIQIFTHISIQFQVLANDILTIVDTNKNGYSKTLSMELKYIVMRHEELYKLIDIMNNQLYSSVIFVSFIIEIWEDDIDSAITMLSVVFSEIVTIPKAS
ncbi:hypothetical protein HCN44_005836 [Aphidius gifuensis]|uniref:Odorant receptor n=1 Tax=Aphidius gifuensis TaxID=684658 RepID=A0A834XVS9_APHGI|nr:hypothetical protein HCN44_005836 [Aphidius gifuensis]